MKRHGAEGGDYPRGSNTKRQRGDGYAEALAAGKFELRFLVSSKSAGAVIGKGGDNIKRLRSQFDANVSVPDSQAPERVLTMITSFENILPISQDVLPKLEEQPTEGKREAKMLVHMSHAGAIIGKAGSKIKELRDETGCNIKVFSECAPQSTDRCVQITGPEQSLPGAVKAIVELVKGIPIKGATRQYDPTNYDPMLAAEYGGHPLGDRSGGPPMRAGGGGGGRFNGGPMGGPRGAGGPMRGGQLGAMGDFGMTLSLFFNK
ncbi:unnamed protein product, partial [Mesorhabditis spiculigera]